MACVGYKYYVKYFHTRVKLILLFLLRINDMNAECPAHHTNCTRPHATISIIRFSKWRKKRMDNARCSMDMHLQMNRLTGLEHNLLLSFFFCYEFHSHIIRESRIVTKRDVNQTPGPDHSIIIAQKLILCTMHRIIIIYLHSHCVH